MKSLQRVKEINHQRRNTYLAKFLSTQDLENIFSDKRNIIYYSKKENLTWEKGWRCKKVEQINL